MKVLVLGAGGMAGHMIALRLAELGNTVVGLARRRLDFCENIVTDVTDVTMLRFVLNDSGFDAVINAIGILPQSINQDPANGIWVNAYLPHLLSNIASATKTKVVHLSTDCVFSGHDNGGYKENDLPTARDLYGRSKWLGELNGNKDLTVRTSIVGPDINENGAGLFNWFMKQKEEVKGFTKAIWTGVTTLTLADAIDAALKQCLTGLYHLVNNECINKYELLKLFSNLRKDRIRIIPEDDFVVDKSLVNTRIDLKFDVLSYAEMVNEMGKWIVRHRGLYKYYEQI